MNAILVILMFVATSCVSDEAPGVTKDFLAALTTNSIRAHQTAKHLSFTARVKNGSDPEIRCEVLHARDAQVNLSIYSGEELIYDFRSHGEGDHVVLHDRSYLAGQTMVRKLALEEYKKHLTFAYKKGFDGCQVGMYMRPWVGENSKHVSQLQRLLPQGEYKGTKEVEGHTYHVIEVVLSEQAKHILYIDPHTYLAGKWDSISGEITRTRTFTYHLIERILPDGSFELP